MTRLLALEEVDAKLRAAITNTLRVSDEATALPAATRSVESGAFKNIVMRISGTEPDLSPELFSSNWWGGVSAVQVPEEVAEPLMRDRHRRARVLRDLRDTIASEMADTDLTVGPELEADGTDVDKKQWICGFDGPACSVGLYSALQSAPPEAGLTGMNRSRKTYYLVCKAGGAWRRGFHARLTAALKKGKSLDEALESGSEPGPWRCAAWPRPGRATASASLSKRPSLAFTPLHARRPGQSDLGTRRHHVHRRRISTPCARFRAGARCGSTMPGAWTRR